MLDSLYVLSVVFARFPEYFMRMLRFRLSHLLACLPLLALLLGMAVPPSALHAQTLDYGLSIVPSPMPAALAGAPYTVQLAGMGGTAPYTFKFVVPGTPTGNFTLSPSGVLSGTPTQVGQMCFQMMVQDSLGHYITTTNCMTVNGALLSLTSQPPYLTVGVPFTTTITATGGTPPYRFYNFGDCGGILTLDGVLNGAFYSQGTHACVIRVRDSANPSFPNTWDLAYPLVVHDLGQLLVDAGSGFSPSLGLHLNGPATYNGTNLNLMDSKPFEAASAWSSAPVDITRFTTDFDYEISDRADPKQYPYSGDGFTFTLQNSDPAALGYPGGDLGYTGIPHSVAVKFDIYNNTGEQENSLGIYTNGEAPFFPSAIATSLVTKGTAHLKYDGVSLILTLTDTNGNTSQFAQVMNLPKIIGSNTAYVGFTAGSGFFTSTLSVSKWTYRAP